MPHINLLSVFLATIASFLLGGAWYSPALFKKTWQQQAGLDDAALAGRNMGQVFAGSFLLTLVASAVFALFIGPGRNTVFGAAAGLAAGLCWVAASFGINYLFERRSLVLFLINGGYHTVQFTIMGAILGAMS